MKAYKAGDTVTCPCGNSGTVERATETTVEIKCVDADGEATYSWWPLDAEGNPTASDEEDYV